MIVIFEHRSEKISRKEYPTRVDLSTVISPLSRIPVMLIFPSHRKEKRVS
ncbi:hypothetical protein LEP1GSC061_2143 [Leptospira wolffii serovar Khorat str. Khorat-H2]|nr:hypothetical protein LEP1GSC061_2143 [Leptospira wolffii serovar Khorat str. Khorat-H2]